MALYEAAKKMYFLWPNLAPALGAIVTISICHLSFYLGKPHLELQKVKTRIEQTVM